MLLRELAERVGGALTGGAESVEVRGLTHDSRTVKPGDLFVCLSGGTFDGHRFAADALARGAAALVLNRDRAAEIRSAPAILVDNTRLALPGMAAAFYGDPSRSLILIGVTGTNGKTTTTYMIASILRAAGRITGTIGTLGAELMGQPIPSEHTTPEADQLQALLATMRDRGARAVAMEVSSHALHQHRTDCCAFDAGVFTNLTQDHLDYHETLDAYFESKLRLFRDYPAASGKPFSAAVNLDDPRGEIVAAQTVGRTVTYAVQRGADVRASDVRISPASSAFAAQTPAGELRISLPIGGSFQVYNALGAISAAIGFGIDPEAIVRGLAEMPPVPGRFESVPTGRDFEVIVDYAHSPDGLENLLESARKLNPSRIITVFGCGGDRDRTKRPKMGAIAGAGSDLVVVTSDNPRTEEPSRIIDDILPGLSGARARVVVEPDRRKAIALALAEARKGDIVLVAGKGHEDYQEIQGVKHPFDDRAVIRELLGGGDV